MILIFSEALKWLLDYMPLLTNVLLTAIIFILLAHTLKRHPRICYTLFGLPLALSVVQFVMGLVGIKDFSLFDVPVVGLVLGANAHMINFGFPLLIVIMYIGALDARRPWVRRLLVVRKEMSIISGFPVLAHALVRVTYTFPKALGYFTDHSAYLEENDWVQCDAGVGLSNAGYVLGVLMLVIFLMLWVTSFDAVHRKMGGYRWKRVQRWAYVLYAMLFIHSVLLHVGWLLNGDPADHEFVIKSCISIASTGLIFLSYLILRLRKAGGSK